MAKNNQEAIVLLLTLLITAGVAGGGLWYLQKSITNNTNNASEPKSSSPTPSATTNPASSSPSPTATSTSATEATSIDASLPNPTVLTIDGSTTMVKLMQKLRNAYAQINPNLPSTYGLPDGKPNGSSKGLEALIANKVVLAASSRPLKPKEAEAGVKLVAIARDAVAVVVGIDNPFKGGLSQDQLRQIYQGKITNWSEVGGPNAPIKVINRAEASGTRDFFQSVVMLSQPFGADGPNFITWPQDETTAILRALGKDGISYATVSQVEKQEIVRIVPIDNVSPTDRTAIQTAKYPINRSVYLAIPKQTSPAVKQFIELALSPQGQQIVQESDFIPLK